MLINYNKISIYDKVKCCVKYKGVLIKWLFSKWCWFNAMRNFTPLLYSLYVLKWLRNEFLLKDNCPSLNTGSKFIFINVRRWYSSFFGKPGGFPTYVKYTYSEYSAAYGIWVLIHQKQKL